MTPQFRLYIQLPKPKDLGVGVISIDKTGTAHFFKDWGEAGSILLAEMVRTKIEFAGAMGIMLSGHQPDGFTKNGQEKFVYQEWWLTYRTDSP